VIADQIFLICQAHHVKCQVQNQKKRKYQTGNIRRSRAAFYYKRTKLFMSGSKTSNRVVPKCLWLRDRRLCGRGFAQNVCLAWGQNRAPDCLTRAACEYTRWICEFENRWWIFYGCGAGAGRSKTCFSLLIFCNGAAIDCWTGSDFGYRLFD